jgi:hypothetical protein
LEVLGDSEALAEAEGDSERDSEALGDKEADFEALGDSERLSEAEGLSEALGDRDLDAEALGETEAEGLTEDDGLIDSEAEGDCDREAEALGDRDLLPEAETEAEGDREAETLLKVEAATRLAPSDSGLQIATNSIVPPVTGAVAIVIMTSLVIIFSVETLDSSNVWSGELSCQISSAIRFVAVVCAMSPAVEVDVPTSIVALAPRILSIQRA